MQFEIVVPDGARPGDVLRFALVPEPDDTQDPEMPAETLFEFREGSLDPIAYNDWVTQANANNQTFRRHGPIAVAKPHLAPYLDSGRLTAWMGPQRADNHCSIRLHEHMQIGRRYGYSFQMRFHYSAQTFIDDTDWAWILQCWQEERLNPPFAIGIKQGQWAVQMRASPGGVPANNDNWPVIEDERDLGAVEAGREYSVLVEYEPHPTDGYAMVEIDGEVIYEHTGPTCIDMGHGPIPFLGIYCDRSKISVDREHVAMVGFSDILAFTEPESSEPTPTPVPAPGRQAKQIVLEPDGNIEKRLVYGTVIPSDEVWRMWYVAWTGTKLALFHATSNDGVYWTRHRNTPVVDNCASVNVSRMPGGGYEAYVSQREGNGFAYRRMMSANGINWMTIDPEVTWLHNSDVICAGAGHVIYKRHGQAREWYNGSRRCSGLGSQGGMITGGVRGLGLVDLQCYGMSLFTLDGRTLALEWVFEIEQRTPAGSEIGVIYPRLTETRDGVRWSTLSTDPIIPLGEEHEFDSGAVIPFASPFIRGDELWVYYSGANYLHSQFTRDPNNTGRVGLVRLPLDRIRDMMV